MTIYDRLGVRPVVNAAGTLTRLGGTLMCAEALQAMHEAARSAVVIDELQEAASRVIARHTGAEAGLVTSGAFGAQILPCPFFDLAVRHRKPAVLLNALRTC